MFYSGGGKGFRGIEFSGGGGLRGDQSSPMECRGETLDV